MLVVIFFFSSSSSLILLLSTQGKISKCQDAKPKYVQFELLIYAMLHTCSSSLVAAMYPTMLWISSCVPPLLRKYLISPYRDVRIVLRSSGAKSLSLQPVLDANRPETQPQQVLHGSLTAIWWCQFGIFLSTQASCTSFQFLLNSSIWMVIHRPDFASL